MKNSITVLSHLFEDVPSDLARFFDRTANGSLSGREELEVNVLSAEDAVRWTRNLADHPMVLAFGAVILDDANTSNHHLYLSAP